MRYFQVNFKIVFFMENCNQAPGLSLHWSPFRPPFGSYFLRSSRIFGTPGFRNQKFRSSWPPLCVVFKIGNFFQIVVHVLGVLTSFASFVWLSLSLPPPWLSLLLGSPPLSSHSPPLYLSFSSVPIPGSSHLASLEYKRNECGWIKK